MTAHRYWRLRSANTAIAGEYMAATEIELRATPGGADVTGSGTASASAIDSGPYSADKAVDNNGSTFWTTGGNAPPSGGHWWAYDFGLGNETEVQEVAYTSRSDGFREDPLDIDIQYSDNGTMWYTKWSVTGMSAWSASETRVWTDPWIGILSASSQLSGGRVRTLYTAPAEEARTSALRSRILYTYTAEGAQLSQADVRTLWDGAGGFEAQASQIFARILIKYGLDSRQLRAWPFTQDDHDFYVLQLGTEKTLVYDKLTEQWAQWKSPGYTYWRGADGVQWEGWNIACDTESGILWEIDADGRLDEGTAPITSVITGGVSTRMRKSVANYMAEVALSEGRPPVGFDDGEVGITLSTSDDGGQTFLSHGEVVGAGSGDDVCIRWYGLGLIPAIGRVFQITDTGYARRIDGLNIEVEEE